MPEVGDIVEFVNGNSRVSAVVVGVEHVKARSGVESRCLCVKVRGDNSTRGYRLINEQAVIDDPGRSG